MPSSVTISNMHVVFKYYLTVNLVDTSLWIKCKLAR